MTPKYADILDILHWTRMDLPDDLPITVLDLVVLNDGHKVEFISFDPDESPFFVQMSKMHAKKHGEDYEPKNVRSWHLRFWCDCQDRVDAMITPHRAPESVISLLFNAIREWALETPGGFQCGNSEPSEEEESCEGP